MTPIPAAFPQELDGATVLYVAAGPAGDFTYYMETGERKMIRYLALASYPEAQGVYCFSVSEDFAVIGDLFYDDVDHAMKDESELRSIAKDQWKKMPNQSTTDNSGASPLRV